MRQNGSDMFCKVCSQFRDGWSRSWKSFQRPLGLSLSQICLHYFGSLCLAWRETIACPLTSILRGQFESKNVKFQLKTTPNSFCAFSYFMCKFHERMCNLDFQYTSGLMGPHKAGALQPEYTSHIYTHRGLPENLVLTHTEFQTTFQMLGQQKTLTNKEIG